MPGRRITKEDKQKVAALRANGLSLRAIESETGVSLATLSRLCNSAELAELIRQARAMIAARFSGLVLDYLDRVEGGQEALSGQALMINYGIASDKFDRVGPQTHHTPVKININIDQRSLALERGEVIEGEVVEP